MARFELRPFIVAEAETVAHWAGSADDAWRVAGIKEGLLSAEQVAAWPLEANYAFTLRLDGDLAAYGEIVEDEVEGDVEIQHLLVAPDMRRQGVGQALLSRLVAFLAASSAYSEVWVRVGRDNEIALQSARSVGFAEDADLSGPRYAWLKKSLRS